MKIRRKGDTYYLRYTFTNPTDAHIEKTLRYADVFHSVSYIDRFSDLFTQRCETPTKFDLPPHASTTITLALTPGEPYIHLEPCIANFYFTDDSLTVIPHHEEPLALMKPIILPNGSLALSVENTSPTETISEIRDCFLFAKFALRDDDCTEWVYQNDRPISTSLGLKPKSTTIIPLQPSFRRIARNPSPNAKLNMQDIFVPMPDVTAVPPTTKLYLFGIDAQINNIPHKFHESTYSHDPTRESSPSYNTNYHSPSYNAHWNVPHTVDITVWNETEDKNLRIYYHIINPYDITIPMDNLIGNFFLSYVTKNSLLCRQHYEYPLPPDTTLPPNGELFFSFFVPLPDDFLTLDRSEINFYDATTRLRYANPKNSPTPLAPLRKVIFTDLGEAILDTTY